MFPLKESEAGCWLSCWRGADTFSFFWSYSLIPWNKSYTNYWWFFSSLLSWRATIRVNGYFPLKSCPAQSVLPLNFISRIEQFFTYFCKPRYCIYWVFLCAQEPCGSHKDPRVCATKALAGWRAAWVRKQRQAEGNCAAFFLNWVSLLGFKQTLLECHSRYLLSDPVECLGYFCFASRAKKQFFGSKSRSRQPEAASLHPRARRAELLRWGGETDALAGTEHSFHARSWLC